MIRSPDLSSASWPHQSIDGILFESFHVVLSAFTMQIAGSILKFVTLALMVLSISTTGLASFEPCDKPPGASWAVPIDHDNHAAEPSDIEDSDDPLASMWLALTMQPRPWQWLMTSTDVDSAGPPSIPIPPPWIG